MACLYIHTQSIFRPHENVLLSSVYANVLTNFRLSRCNCNIVLDHVLHLICYNGGIKKQRWLLTSMSFTIVVFYRRGRSSRRILLILLGWFVRSAVWFIVVVGLKVIATGILAYSEGEIGTCQH